MWIILGLVVAIIFLLWCLQSPFYWSNRNVPYSIPLPVLGNCLTMISDGVMNFNKSLYHKFPGHDYFGMHLFTRPTMFIKDPALVQRILVTDFDYFTSHGVYTNQDRDPAGGNLFHIHGQQWKAMRSKLSPYFAHSKVKVMIHQAESSVAKAMDVIDKEIAENKPIEMKTIMMSVTTDVITRAIFGVEADTFDNEDSVFRRIAAEMFGPKLTLRQYVGIVSPRLYELFKLHVFDEDSTRKVVDITRKAIEYRRKENVHIPDYLQGMLELVEKNHDEPEPKFFPDQTRVPRYDLDTLICQAILLFAAGVETSALAMTYFLYEVATNPDVQQKCREEVDAVAKENNNEINVDSLQKLVYLGAALQETLRLHAPVTLIIRECTRSYKLPNTDVIFKKGDFAAMSPNASQTDPKYFPEPDKFIPERFMNGNKVTTGSFFPFGLGPRTCLGMGLANNEMKFVCAKLLQRYEFSTCAKTDPTPMKRILLKTPVNGMWLKLSPIKKDL